MAEKKKLPRLRDLRELETLFPMQTENVLVKTDRPAYNRSEKDLCLGLGPEFRSCGPCKACCIYLQIDSEPGFSTLLGSSEDIAKKAGKPCKYLGPKGCLVYDRRPKVCRQFSCDWLADENQSHLNDSPIYSGVIGVRGINFIFDPKK